MDAQAWIAGTEAHFARVKAMPSRPTWAEAVYAYNVSLLDFAHALRVSEADAYRILSQQAPTPRLGAEDYEALAVLFDSDLAGMMSLAQVHNRTSTFHGGIIRSK